jgi:hypothetical protein
MSPALGLRAGRNTADAPNLDRLVVVQGAGSDDIERGMASDGQDDVRVTLQALHDLLGLQIPDVYHVVLAAADDPLAVRDGEGGKDAVLLVLVPLIGLQAFAGGAVPELERAVQSARQNKLSVRGELDEADGRLLVVRLVLLHQRLQTLPRGRVPDAD